MKNLRNNIVPPPAPPECDATAQRRKESQRVSAYLCLVILLGSLLTAARANDAKPADERAANVRLADAAEFKRWTEVEELAERGIDPDQTQADGMTALHWAVFHGDEKTVRLLIDSKCDVNATTRYQVTPLSIACQLGRPEGARQLLAAGANANFVQPGGVTLLMTAARTGNTDCVSHLLKNKADVNAAERRGQTALMWAGAHQCCQAITGSRRRPQHGDASEVFRQSNATQRNFRFATGR